MTGRTLIIEFHGYRGLRRAGGPLGMVTTIGFISVAWVPFLVTEWLAEKIAGLRSVARMRRSVEMDCFGEVDTLRERPRHK